MREKTLRRTTAADEIQILDSHRDFYVFSALGDVIEQNVYHRRRIKQFLIRIRFTHSHFPAPPAKMKPTKHRRSGDGTTNL